MDKRKRLTAEQIIKQYQETISHIGEQKSKEERNRHFATIRDRAEEIVLLLNADCSYVSVADQLCDYLELDKNLPDGIAPDNEAIRRRPAGNAHPPSLQRCLDEG